METSATVYTFDIRSNRVAACSPDEGTLAEAIAIATNEDVVIDLRAPNGEHVGRVDRHGDWNLR